MNKILKPLACLLVGSAILMIGCGADKTEAEIEKENERSRKQVDEYINPGKMKTSGTVIAKVVGGTGNIVLPPRTKLVLITWKGNDAWILTRPFRDGEKPETYTYQESSKWGVLEATIVIREKE